MNKRVEEPADERAGLGGVCPPTINFVSYSTLNSIVGRVDIVVTPHNAENLKEIFNLAMGCIDQGDNFILDYYEAEADPEPDPSVREPTFHMSFLANMTINPIRALLDFWGNLRCLHPWMHIHLRAT